MAYMTLIGYSLLLTGTTLLVAHLVFRVLLVDRIRFPETKLRCNYTTGGYYTYWANVYQTNAALRVMSWVTFMRDPIGHLQARVLSIPTVDVEIFEPLLPGQKVSAAAAWMQQADRKVLEKARRFLNNDEFQNLLERVRADGNSRYQFLL